MNLGRLCQIILKSDKEISGYGQLAQHAISHITWYGQGAPKVREKKLPLDAVSGNINHRVPRSNWRIKFWFKMVENVADYDAEKR